MASGSCCHPRHLRRTLLRDINVWTTMVAIMAAAYPTKALIFLQICKPSQKTAGPLGGLAWASYHMAFRHQAAKRGSLDWGIVDAALYNEAFTGQAKQIPRCRYCLADTQNTLRGHGPSGCSLSSVICFLLNTPGGSKCKFSVLSICPPMRQVQTPPPSSRV